MLAMTRNNQGYGRAVFAAAVPVITIFRSLKTFGSNPNKIK